MFKLAYLFFIVLLIISLTLVFSLNPTPKIHDVLIHPDNYARLPDDLTPYCCGEVVNGVCDGKVDLDTAAYRVARGLNPREKVLVDKSILRCD